MTFKRTHLALAVITAVLLFGCTLSYVPITLDQTRPAPTATALAPDGVQLNDCVPSAAQIESATVVEIIDGDTVDVTIGGKLETVRYIGMDTPERGTTYYREASARNGELVMGKQVVLAKDVSETDRFDRLLRYVFVDGVFVNQTLVREGFAYAKEYPPDTACAGVFSAAEADAEADRVGLWGLSVPQAATPTQAVTQAPAGSCPTGCVEPTQGCEIKGNINSEGVKIYHVPGSGSYAQTQINPERGERWFCTAEEAEANGWRAPRN